MNKINLVKILRNVAIVAFTAFMITLAVVLALRLANKSPGENQALDLYKDPLSFSTSTREGSFMKLERVKFRMTEKVSMDVHQMAAEVIPLKGKIVNFDDINSFAIDIYQGHVSLTPAVMEYIFNKIVLNFKDSPLRNMKIEFVQIKKNGKKVSRVKTTGEMKMMVWLPFEMIGAMKLDKKRVLLYLEAEKITSLGNPMTKQLMSVIGLDLGKVMKIPANRGIKIQGNRIIIEPFRIFPPPRIGGYLDSLQIKNGQLHFYFANKKKIKFARLPRAASNYIFLYKGEVKFGKLTMIDARLQMIDKDTSDYLDFYLKKYFIPLVKGHSEILKDGSVAAYVPDYGDVTGR